MKPLNEIKYYEWKEIRKKRKSWLFWSPTLLNIFVLFVVRNYILKNLLFTLFLLVFPYLISSLTWYINENKYKKYKKD